MIREWHPDVGTPLGKADRKSRDWERFTAYEPDHDNTEWISVDREYVFPVEEVR